MIERNSKFLAQLERHEGFRPKVYRCTAGKRTIGFGHNLDANPIEGIDEKSLLTLEAAEAILIEDVSRFAKLLDDKIPWWRSLNPPRQAVILNMAFNMGVKSLLGFTNTLARIKQGKYEDAAKGMLKSRWASQVKGRATELAKQMKTEEWQEK